MRILHGRDDRDRIHAHRGPARRPAAADEGQPVPVHGVSVDPPAITAGVPGKSERPRPGTDPAGRRGRTSVVRHPLAGRAGGHRHRAVHLRPRSARAPGASGCWARRMRMPGSCRSTPRPPSALDGRRTRADPPQRAGHPVLHRPPREPPGRSRRHPDPRRRGAIRRPTRRGGGRRRAPAAAEAACRPIVVDYEVLPAVFDPKPARSPGAPLMHPDRHRPTGSPTRRTTCRRHPRRDRRRRRRRRCPLAAVTVRGPWRTQRVPHAQLETHGTLGWIDDDGRLVIRTSSQVPFLVRDELCRLLELPPGSGAGAHQAGRRRFRRQAGDAHRGPGRARPCCGPVAPVSYEMSRDRRVRPRPPCGTRCGSTVTLGARRTAG